MSPRKSKAIVLPSGLTSNDIQVPSFVLIEILRSVSSGRSFFFFGFSFLTESVLDSFLGSCAKVKLRKSNITQRVVNILFINNLRFVKGNVLNCLRKVT